MREHFWSPITATTLKIIFFGVSTTDVPRSTIKKKMQGILN